MHDFQRFSSPCRFSSENTTDITRSFTPNAEQWKMFTNNHIKIFAGNTLFVSFSAEDAVEKKRLSSDSSRAVSTEENGVPNKKHEVSFNLYTIVI